MSYACFLCRRSFQADYSFMQHLDDYHDWWEYENENLNANFQTFSWNMRCPYCNKGFNDLTAYLNHVLSNCKTATNNDLYWDRQNEVLSEFREAVLLGTDDYEERDWKVVSTLENTDYMLPHGIQNAPGGSSPDILVYSRASREAIIIELSVPWETNIPQAHLDALERMKVWSNQFEAHGYDCICYGVEVGARGSIANSFYDCLDELEIDDDEISAYALHCAGKAIEYSQYLLQGNY